MNMLCSNSKAQFVAGEAKSVRMKYIWVALAMVVVFALAVLYALHKRGGELRRLPTSLIPIDSHYYCFVKRNLTFTDDQLRQISDTSFESLSDRPRLHREVVTFARSLELDERTSLNNAIHALMTFGADHPVRVNEKTTVSVLSFIQNYYDYLAPEIREYAPAWIGRIGDEHFVIMSWMPRILLDHLGQLSYACAMAEVPLDTTFKLKSGGDISLDTLLKTEIKYADPDIHDPIWQTAALAYYWPDKTWRSVNKRLFSPLDFVEKTSDSILGHFACGNTHPLISAGYAISKLEGRYEGAEQKRQRLKDCKQKMEYWIAVIRETLSTDGMVSRKWCSNEKEPPLNLQEVIIYNGHVMEFLAVYLDKERISSEWVGKIGDRFCSAVIEAMRHCAKTSGGQNTALPFEYASLCHGVRGLIISSQKLEADRVTERTSQ